MVWLWIRVVGKPLILILKVFLIIYTILFKSWNAAMVTESRVELIFNWITFRNVSILQCLIIASICLCIISFFLRSIIVSNFSTLRHMLIVLLLSILLIGCVNNHRLVVLLYHISRSNSLRLITTHFLIILLIILCNLLLRFSERGKVLFQTTNNQ